MSYKIPAHLLASLIRYRDDGIPTGGTLRAILSNDLKGTFRSADEKTTAAMKDLVAFVVNEMPAIAQGSEEKVDAWIESKRKERMEGNL